MQPQASWNTWFCYPQRSHWKSNCPDCNAITHIEAILAASEALWQSTFVGLKPWVKALNINTYSVGIIPTCEGHKNPSTLEQNYTLLVALEKSWHNEEGDEIPWWIWQTGQKYCWLWSVANTSQGVVVKCKLNEVSKLQQGHASRRNRVEVETIQEHVIKLYPILNKCLKQNIRGWAEDGIGQGAVCPSNIKYLRTSERLQLSHPGNAQTKETTGL